VVAVLARAAKREFDHMGLAHDHAELAAQPRDQRPVSLPGLRRQAPARPGEAGIAGSGEQVLERDGQPLERPGRQPGSECGVGRLGDGAGLIGRPERIGVQALAKALVPGNGCFDQFPSARPPFAQVACNLDQRTGQRIFWHRHLLQRCANTSGWV